MQSVGAAVRRSDQFGGVRETTDKEEVIALETAFPCDGDIGSWEEEVSCRAVSTGDLVGPVVL